MELLIPTSLLSKPSFCPSSYPNFAFNGDASRLRYFPRSPNHRTSIPLRISLSSQQNLTSNANLSEESDSENLSGGESKFKSIEVIGIGSRKDAVIDFCLESPFQSSTSLRFWNLQLKESREVQLLLKSREQDSVLRNIEGSVSQLSSSQAVVLVASAGYGVDHVTAIELLRAIKSANGLAIGIILKPFNFEGQRRQDEVNDLVNELWEHTNFCIVVDTDALLKREVVTLAEALRSANNAVLLAMNAISILMSDIHTKFLDQPNSKVKELKVLEIAELLESYKKAKVGFGAGNNMKSSIAQAVFDCPFLDESIKDNSMVVCTVTSCNVINYNDMHDFLQTFRRTTGFKKDIVISVVHEPNMEPNLIVTTLITLGCNEEVVSQKQGFLSSLALRFPFVFSLLGRVIPDKDTLPVHSHGNTLGVNTSSCSVDMPNLDSADGGDESLDPFSEEREIPLGSNYDEISDFRESNDDDKRRNDETLKGHTDYLSNVNDRTSEEQPAFQREPLISRNVGPGFHIAREWAKVRAISEAAPVLEKKSFFVLPVGVKPFGQSTDSLSNTPQPSEPRVLDGIKGLSQDTPEMLSWDGLTDAGVEAVMDVYNAASTLLKGKNAAIPRKEGVLSIRAASMLEAERVSEKKWSPTTEMQYSGGIYKGRCQGGLPEGKGCLTLPNGSIYDGMWRYGKRSGLGTFYYSNGDVFQGSWRDDLMHGRGWFYFHTGDRWFVNFWKGKPNGEGRFYSNGGEIFFGSFQDGWRHGDSLFIDVEGRRWAETWDEGVLLSREQLDSELSAE